MILRGAYTNPIPSHPIQTHPIPFPPFPISHFPFLSPGEVVTVKAVTMYEKWKMTLRGRDKTKRKKKNLF